MGNFGAPGLGLDNFVTGNTVADTVAAPGQQAISDQTYEGTRTHLNPDRPYNPPGHPRSWGVSPTGMGRQKAPQLLRGRISMWGMEQGGPIPGASRSYSRSLNFLYNPNTITHSYSMDPNSIPPEARVALDKATPNLISGQSVAWKLYFNRQYDVADPRGDPDRKSGVLADIAALERMMGVTLPGEGIQAVPLLVVFGTTANLWDSAVGVAGGRPFAYWGFISSLTINYLMFTHRMIPTVCEVDIQLSRRLAPEVTAPSDAYAHGDAQANLGAALNPTTTIDGTPVSNQPRTATTPSVGTITNVGGVPYYNGT